MIARRQQKKANPTQDIVTVKAFACCALAFPAWLRTLVYTSRLGTLLLSIDKTRVQTDMQLPSNQRARYLPHRGSKTEFAGMLPNCVPKRGPACPSAPSVLRPLGLAAYHRSLKRVQSTFFQKFWMYFSLPHTP